MKHRSKQFLSILLGLALLLGLMPGMSNTAYAIYEPNGLDHFIPLLDNEGSIASYDVSVRVNDDHENYPRKVRLLFSELSKTDIFQHWPNKDWNYLDGDSPVISDTQYGEKITVSGVGIDTQDISYNSPKPGGINTLNFQFDAVSLDASKTYNVYFILRVGEWGQSYSIYRIIGDSLGTLKPMKINYNKQKADGTYNTSVVNTHYISGKNLDVSKLGTVPTGYHLNTSKSTNSGNWDGSSAINIYYDLDVDISLTPSSTTLTVGDTQALTAAIVPSNATDKTVKWSISGTNTDAVKLYSDSACTTEVGTAATDKLTVYAKGISEGSATITVTSNADNTKTDKCEVTVNIATYTVNYKIENGTWSDGSTDDKTETVTSGAKPASVPTGMKASEGYTGGAWDTDPAGATITEATTFTYTFTAIPIYTVTVTNDGHGTGSAAPVSGAEGTEVTLNATPAEGYVFKEWQVVSGGVTVKDNKYTIGTANVEIKAVFEQAGDMEDEVIVEPGAPAVSGTNIDEVAAGVVTADEVAAGVKVWVDISPLAEAAVPAGDKALANQAMQGFGGTAGAWIDMSMFKQVAGQSKTAVHQTATAFRFSMKVPDSLKKAGRTFWLLRLHNDKADILATTTGDTLSGETNLFSTYLIAYKDAETPTPTPKPVPKTGDQDHPGLWIILMLIGIAGLTVIGTLKVSRKRK